MNELIYIVCIDIFFIFENLLNIFEKYNLNKTGHNACSYNMTTPEAVMLTSPDAATTLMLP